MLCNDEKVIILVWSLIVEYHRVITVLLKSYANKLNACQKLYCCWVEFCLLSLTDEKNICSIWSLLPKVWREMLRNVTKKSEKRKRSSSGFVDCVHRVLWWCLSAQPTVLDSSQHSESATVCTADSARFITTQWVWHCLHSRQCQTHHDTAIHHDTVSCP